MAVIVFKVALALASGLLGAWALRTRLLEWPERQFRAGVLALQLVPALGMFVVLYVAGHQEPTSDVPAFYLPAARATLGGQVPFRDFAISYAPGFAYVGAALTFIWNSGKVFAAFAICLNALALLWWHSAASTSLDRGTARQCTVLYATSGHVLVQALLGTNQAWVNAGLAASAMLMTRDSNLAAGLAQAVTAGTTKILAHLFWPVQWICASRRSGWLLGAVLPTVILYAVFVMLGAGPGLLHPLRYEGELISPGNLPYVLDLVLAPAGSFERAIDDGLSLAVLAVATVWLYTQARRLAPERRPALLLAGLALTGLVFMLFSKKSFTGYILFVLYPVVLMLVRGLAEPRARMAFLLAFNALLVSEPSLWFYLGGNPFSLRAWLAHRSWGAVVGFELVDVALLACYVYLAWLSVRSVERVVSGATVSSNSSQPATACSLV